MHATRIAVLTLALAAGFVLSLEADPQTPSKDAPPHTDLYGDPLPEGAVARLGTVRFRKAGENCHAVAFSPDGKTLAALDAEGQVSLWDAATGRLAFEEHRLHQKGRNPVDRVNAFLAFAPDGKTLIAGLDEPHTARPLCVWDVERRKEVCRLDDDESGFFSAASSADGKTVAAVTRDHEIVVREAATGVRQWVQKTQAQALALSPDGTTLAVGDADKKIHLLEAESGKEIHALEEQGNRIDALAFAPDGKTLAVVDERERVVLWDAARGVRLRWWQVLPERNPNNRSRSGCTLAFSSDAKTLAVCWQFGEIDLYDPSSGERRQMHPDAGPACCFSPDGAVLAVGAWGGVRLWDMAAERPLRQSPNYDVYDLRFSPDDKTLIVAAGWKISLWDPAAGKWLRDAETGVYQGFLLHDGWVASVPPWKGGAMRCRTAIRGWTVKIPADAVWLWGASPDGKTLAVLEENAPDSALVLRDSATGKEPRRLVVRPNGVTALAFSPDGRFVAALLREALASEKGDVQWMKPSALPVCRIWDVASGKLLRTFPSERGSWGASLVFSPDGRYLGVNAVEAPFRLYEAATGKLVLERDLGGSLIFAVAFSPDGDTLASADHSLDAAVHDVIRLWDLSTGKEVRQFTAREQAHIQSLAFSHDSGRLASGSRWAGTVLVWNTDDVVKRERQPAVRLTANEVEGLWTDLGGADAVRAFRAGHTLARSPEDAPAFLAARLTERQAPSPPAEAKRLARLVADLGSESFEDRDRASKELDRLGAAAVRSLRGRLKDDDLPLEARLRIQQWLVRKSEDAPDEAADRQWSRATEVLERLGTPEARKLLDKLTADADRAVAEQAKASLGRLSP